MYYRRLGDPFSGRYSRLGSGSRPSGGVPFVPVVFVWRDDYPGNEAAPIVSPRVPPATVIGTGTVVDPNTKISIVGDELDFATGASTGHYVTYGNQVRAAGFVAMGIDLNISLEGTFIGWTDNVIQRRDGIFQFRNVAIQVLIASIALAVDTYAIGTDYEVASILRGTGWFPLVRGGAFAEWTLLYPIDVVSDAMMVGKVGAEDTTSIFTLGSFRGAQLPTPWDTDNGIATEVLAGARNAGDTFTHEADCLIEFEQTTLPAAGQTEMRFRIQDASNYWQVTIDSAGDIDLDEVVATVVTQRGTAAAVIANGDRIVIIADDETIRVFEANVLRITYALAANFKTRTAGELEDEGAGGSVSDIISWPRVISGDALTELNRVATAP